MKNFLVTFFLLIFSGMFGQSDTDDAALAAQRAVDSMMTAVENEKASLTSERIRNFESEITVDNNGTADIREKITVTALGLEIKRGIYRTLPLKRELNGKSRNVKYEVISVKKNGDEEQFHTENESGFLRIYIGDPDEFLDSGVYEYEIHYTAENQVGFFEKYDEFYWNVNGTFWNFPIDQLKATVRVPVHASLIQNSCYTGEYGSSSQNCSVKVIDNQTLSWTAKNLSSREGLTVAVGFTKGVVAPPPPPTFFEKFGILIIALLGFISLIVYYISTWQKHGVDPQKTVVYLQFSAPQNLSPASLGYLKKERFSNSFLTAAFVNLAVKGYLKIEETKSSGLGGFFGKNEFVISKLKKPSGDLPTEEKAVMEQFFGSRDSVKFDGEYDSTIESAVDYFKNNLKLQHDQFLDSGNNRSKLWLPFIVISLIYFAGLYYSFALSGEGGKVVAGMVLYGLMVTISAIALFFIREFTFSWKMFLFLPVVIFLFAGNGIAFGENPVDDRNFFVCYLFLILSFTAFAIYSFLIKRPSVEKLQTKSLIEGFKMYMGAAENEQLKFHNPPAMTPQVFETLLPFAIVLGVDKIWGDKFASMLKNSAETYQNNWYIGSSFNSATFGSTLNSNLSSSIASASTAPSSSGSGSGGGGFSGGGGGGGGGGGW